MRVSDKMADAITVFEAVAWIGTCIACMIGWAWGWIFVVGFMVLGHILVGVRSNEVISKKFLTYPVLAWFVLYNVSMIGSVYYHLHFLDNAPTFYIMGQHPSHFFMLMLYWIGGILTISVGFVLRSKEWCSDESWNNFLTLVEKTKEAAK